MSEREEHIETLEKVLVMIEQLRPHLPKDEAKLNDMAKFLQSRLMVLRGPESRKEPQCRSGPPGTGPHPQEKKHSFHRLVNWVYHLAKCIFPSRMFSPRQTTGAEKGK